MKEKIVLIVHINEKYSDIADVFFKLFQKNWIDCQYDVIISCKGNLLKEYGYKKRYSIENESLPEAVYEIMKEEKANYCISFLGDAFLGVKINSEDIKKYIQFLIDSNALYARLYHSKNNRNLYNIKKSEVYGVSFIAFFASFEFAKKEFIGKTDLDFEKKYLDIARVSKNTYQVWDKMYALPNDVFNIIHGLVKGEWIRDSYTKVYKLLKEPIISNHPKMKLYKYIFYRLKILIRNNINITYIHRLFSNF